MSQGAWAEAPILCKCMEYALCWLSCWCCSCWVLGCHKTIDGSLPCAPILPRLRHRLVCSCLRPTGTVGMLAVGRSVLYVGNRYLCDGHVTIHWLNVVQWPCAWCCWNCWNSCSSGRTLAEAELVTGHPGLTRLSLDVVCTSLMPAFLPPLSRRTPSHPSHTCPLSY